MTADGFPLILAGHTHGGQLCIPGYGALVTNCDLPPSRAKGSPSHAHAGRRSLLHVSAGLGTSPFAPVRFACPPEATLLTLIARGKLSRTSAEVLLVADSPGLREPPADIGVHVVGPGQPEGVQDVARRVLLDPAKPRVLESASENDMAVQPVPAGHERGEAHPDLERDPGTFGQHRHGTNGGDRRQDLVEGLPHGGIRPVEVPVEIAERSARVLWFRPANWRSHSGHRHIGPVTSAG